MIRRIRLAALDWPMFARARAVYQVQKLDAVNGRFHQPMGQKFIQSASKSAEIRS